MSSGGCPERGHTEASLLEAAAHHQSEGSVSPGNTEKTCVVHVQGPWQDAVQQVRTSTTSLRLHWGSRSELQLTEASNCPFSCSPVFRGRRAQPLHVIPHLRSRGDTCPAKPEHTHTHTQTHTHTHTHTLRGGGTRTLTQMKHWLRCERTAGL